MSNTYDFNNPRVPAHIRDAHQETKITNKTILTAVALLDNAQYFEQDRMFTYGEITQLAKKDPKINEWMQTWSSGKTPEMTMSSALSKIKPNEDPFVNRRRARPADGTPHRDMKEFGLKKHFRSVGTPAKEKYTEKLSGKRPRSPTVASHAPVRAVRKRNRRAPEFIPLEFSWMERTHASTTATTSGLDDNPFHETRQGAQAGERLLELADAAAEAEFSARAYRAMTALIETAALTIPPEDPADTSCSSPSTPPAVAVTSATPPPPLNLDCVAVRCPVTAPLVPMPRRIPLLFIPQRPVTALPVSPPKTPPSADVLGPLRAAAVTALLLAAGNASSSCSCSCVTQLQQQQQLQHSV